VIGLQQYSPGHFDGETPA